MSNPSTRAVIYHKRTAQTNGRYYKSVGYARAALRLLEKNKTLTPGEYKVSNLTTYRTEIDTMVETTNMMNGLPVMIRKSEEGTAMDPSQERYWTM